MMLFESLIFNLLPAAVGIMVLMLVFESCWRKCPPDKLMIVSGAGKMRSVSGNRADMGDAEAEELMRDRRRFSRIDHRRICPDAYPHIGIHTPRHIRAHAYIHTSTIAHMRARIKT